MAAEAAPLVQAALQAELNGDVSQHGEMLSRAIQADPDHAPARWQNGQVMFEGEWRTPAEVAELTSTDKRWQEYRQLKASASGSIADHEALAKWCLRQGLSAEERYHWCNVLLAFPAHQQARQRLGVREFRGGLFTEEQIAQHKQQLKQAEANMRRYKPRFIELCRQARGESTAAREAALAEIRQITDPGAIEPLRTAMLRDRRSETEPRSRDLHLALIAALANIPEHEATLYLLNYALFSDSEEIRQLAAESLRPRKTTDYVPLLMAALQAPIEVQFDVVAGPGGTVRMMETLHQSGPESDVAHVQDTNFEVAGVQDGDPRINPNQVLGDHLSRAQKKAEATKERVAAHNEAVAERNARIQETLKVATGMDLGPDPEKYWLYWSDENELHYEEEKPEYSSYNESTHTYVYQPAPEYPLIHGDMRSEYPRPARRPASRLTPVREDGPVFGREPVPAGAVAYSCFAPGTLVWTMPGPVPIERIAIGDMVLAQHPASGELAYRPVLATTVGPPVPVLRLALAGESITATPGHRFWVNGSGWQMAKALKPAMKLHAVSDDQEVKAIDPAEEISCHNLVVDEFHTFFVGETKLLVHDKSCPQPTTALIPGLAPSRKAPTGTLVGIQAAR